MTVPGAGSAGRTKMHLGNERLRQAVRRTALYVTATFFAALFFGPFFWTVSSSLKHYSELFLFPPALFPKVPMWGNYAKVWTEVPFGRWMWNSVLITTLSVTGTVVSSAIVGFSFGRFRYPGRDALFMLTLATVMLPSEVTLVPSYILFAKLQWVNTFRPLIVPSWLGGGAFNIFLMRQFFMTIPREFDDAARIDGANSLHIFLRLLLPLIKPALATVAVIAFIAQWDAFMEPMIYLNSTQKYTLALGIRFFQQYSSGEGVPRDNLLMAASMIMIAPPIISFFLAQRYFVRGIVMSGIKG